MTEVVKSPCIGVCAIDDLTGFCQGCYRTLDEITGWWDMDVAAQKALIDTAATREQDAVDFD